MLTPTEHKILRDWKDHIAYSYKVFKTATRTKASLADYLYAVNSEAAWLKRQYPTVKDKLIISRALKNLLEAYQRAAEYPVRLTWKSLASFAINRRPSILWAVLQAKADGPAPVQKPEVPSKAKVQRITERQYCSACQTQALVINNQLECCGKPIGDS
jgi:hypothetical protein